MCFHIYIYRYICIYIYTYRAADTTQYVLSNKKQGKPIQLHIEPRENQGSLNQIRGITEPSGESFAIQGNLRGVRCRQGLKNQGKLRRSVFRGK